MEKWARSSISGSQRIRKLAENIKKRKKIECLFFFESKMQELGVEYKLIDRVFTFSCEKGEEVLEECWNLQRRK